MQDLARFSQMEKLLLLLLLLMIKPSARTVENDQDRLAVKKARHCRSFLQMHVFSCAPGVYYIVRSKLFFSSIWKNGCILEMK